MSRELFKCELCQSFDEKTSTCRYDPPVTRAHHQISSSSSNEHSGYISYPIWEARWPEVKPDDWCRKWNAQ